MKKLQSLSSILKIVFSFVLAFGFIGCNGNIEDNLPKIQASNLMHGITAQTVNTVALDEQFRNAAANFSLNLFRNTISDSGNSLISPASVLIALAMAANGADGNTLSQMEQVIGGGMPIAQLNAYFYSFVKNLTSHPKEKISISNSIWFRELGFTPNRDFLQTNANYFNADAFAAPFNNQTVNDINTWINKATDGLIKEMLKSIPQDPPAVLYLINTILFDAEWANIYEKRSVRNGEFTNYDNQKQTVKFMHSYEYLYIQGNGATGFIKPYHSGRYSFAAILPDKGVDIFDYIAELSGEEYFNLIGNANRERVITALPKFKYEYDVLMNDALEAMGMEEAFSEETANLSRMGNWVYGALWISRVLHKANIAVDERGTKAGAATVIEPVGPTSGPPTSPHYVTLDRPFVYAIIDNETNLPLFIGSLLSIPY